MIRPELQRLAVPIDSLRPNPRNPRNGDTDAIIESLRLHGQYRPIVIREGGEIVAGHHTYAAMMEMGAEEIAVTALTADDEEALKINLVDNRTNDVAGYDEALLVELLQGLPDLEGTGYDQRALDKLLAEVGGPLKLGEDEPPEPPEDPTTKLGDLYVLGEHRLLCGDATEPGDLDRVYGDRKVGAVVTDPPYGIGLDTDYSRIKGSAKSTVKGRVHGRTYRPVGGDTEPFDATFLATYFDRVAEQFWFGANYYRRTLSGSDLDGSWLVWDKRNEGSDAVIGSAFELIWSKAPHKQDVLRFLWTGFTARNDVERSHPTEKSVKLLAEILQRWAPRGCFVADPFGGSGTALLAAERTGRSAGLVELDPRYCDVIVRRWEEATGKTAELVTEEAVAA